MLSITTRRSEGSSRMLRRRYEIRLCLATNNMATALFRNTYHVMHHISDGHLLSGRLRFLGHACNANMLKIYGMSIAPRSAWSFHLCALFSDISKARRDHITVHSSINRFCHILGLLNLCTLIYTIGSTRAYTHSYICVHHCIYIHAYTHACKHVYTNADTHTQLVHMSIHVSAPMFTHMSEHLSYIHSYTHVDPSINIFCVQFCAKAQIETL